MARGRFISLEGGEGAGKSTQARLLSAWLEKRGVGHLLCREPGGTEGAEAIRALLMRGSRDRWGGPAEALLFAAARSDLTQKVIRPALEAGKWVVCDRYVDSSRAYQGGAHGLGDEDILALHRVGSGGLLPDRTLWLDLGVEEGAARAASRDGAAADRFAAQDAAFHRRVSGAFAGYAAAEPDRFRRIDAGQPVEAVQADIRAALSDWIEGEG